MLPNGWIGYFRTRDRRWDAWVSLTRAEAGAGLEGNLAALSDWGGGRESEFLVRDVAVTGDGDLS